MEQLMKLPGIGPKTAERLAFFILRQPKSYLKDFSEALETVHRSITHCSRCHTISEKDPCSICTDTKRDTSSLCVVADAHDLAAIESMNEFRGYYHVLNGVLSPLQGITPQMLTIDSLLAKIQKQPVKEIILALNPDTEGEATIMYLNTLLKPFKIKITRLAKGLPIGSDIEYADEITLSNAYLNRKEI